jgi:putative DNA primase/helicase
MTARAHDSNQVLKQFEAAAVRRGLVLPSSIIADGKIHRCDVKGKRGKHGKGDGTYLLHLEGAVPAGGFNNWTDGDGWEDWSVDIGREFSAAEKQELKKKYEAARKARDEDRARTVAKARDKASRLWNGATACTNHPYLTKKNIAANGARLLYRSLVVPLRDADGAIHNLQFISADGKKRFLKGSKVTGFFHHIEGEAGRICVAEGFATAATIRAVTGRTAIVAFDAGNLRPVAEAIRQRHPDAEIVICADDDKNNVGLTKAKAAAQAIDGLVAVPEFGRNRRDRDTDFNDLAEWIGSAAVRRCIEAATAPPPVATIAELAKLSPIEFDRRRKAAAEQLGVRLTALEDEVKLARKGINAGQGRKVEAQEVEPWDKPVDGAELLDEMSAAILAHIVLTKEQADTVALFSVYTHGYQMFKVAPRLGVRAPTRECGKSELLLRIQRFVPRPLSTENFTGPVLFRLIEDQHPTLFVDELDNLLSDSKSELLGLFNSGYARNGKAYRLVAVGDNHELREFSTFSPLVYGMIGKPTDSFNSRSIPIEMRRATPAEWRALRSLEDGEEEDHRLLAMGRKAARWAIDNLDKLKTANPDMGSMTNRPATNWRPLFAVAEVAGGEWKARARAAAGIAAKLKQTPVDEEELFTVIKAAFDTSTKDYVESDSLVRTLAEVEGGPWAEYGRTEKPITTSALARLLRRFGIGPGYVGPEAARRRGYTRGQFEEVFASYVADTRKNEDSKCAGVQNAMDAAQVEPRKCAAPKSAEQWLHTLKLSETQQQRDSAHLHSCEAEKEGSADERCHPAAAPSAEPPSEVAPPTSREMTEPTEAASPRAEVVPPKHVWDDLDIPEFLRRTPNPPALGPPGDSLDDFK